jgi:hypothetical protein
MSHRSIWVTLASVSLSAFACGGGVSYSGSSQPRVVDPVRLGTGDRAPAGHERLGHVSAECTRVDARDGLDGEELGDVGCSAALLLTFIRDRAASVGGAFLVGERCDTDDASRRDGSLECDAEVWGPAPGVVAAPLEPLPPNVDPWGPAAPLGVAYGAVGDARHVLVDYWPAAGSQDRAPIPVEAVNEIDFPRVGTVVLGSVRATADGSRRMASVRGALRAAAARAGATSLVGVRCIDADGERTCVASLAAPEVDEQAIAPRAAAQPLAGAGY